MRQHTGSPHDDKPHPINADTAPSLGALRTGQSAKLPHSRLQYFSSI